MGETFDCMGLLRGRGEEGVRLYMYTLSLSSQRRRGLGWAGSCMMWRRRGGGG